MEQHLGTATCHMTARVSTPAGLISPLPAEFLYQAGDPYAVQLSLGPSTGSARVWTFARDLLAEGVERPAGAGDVRVVPRCRHHPYSLRIVLSNRDGTALIELPAEKVAGFLRQAFSLVPPGTESRHLNIDGTITALMGRSR
ncbi:SsgA family sporulation/cell division regulator [Streptomyces eurythermus]|uniref:SsgA family sporulation/cell division regulator n=1 Tax=Streptomyces eurythermus TaxID=42237 RepID=UPI0037005C54